MFIDRAWKEGFTGRPPGYAFYRPNRARALQVVVWLPRQVARRLPQS